MLQRTKTLLGTAALASLLLALPAIGQDAEPALEAAEEVVAAGGEVPQQVQYILNSFLMLFGGVLVFWMAAGFTMLESGLVRSKNVSMQILKNITMYSLAVLAYYVIGYQIMYPGDGWLIDGILGAIGIAVLEPVGLAPEAADLTYATTSSDFFFQVMFCATAASIVSGTVAERIKLWPFLAFVFVLTALIYPIQASWKWGGGFLDADFGFLDFAGSTVVHSVGGWAALAGAIILGARKGKYNENGSVNPIPGSSMPLAALGMFILWMGWYGFNGASQLAMGTVGDIADVGRVMANTNAGAVGGALAAAVATYFMYKKIDVTMVINGALAGLVSITAEPLTPGMGTASLIGAVGGIIVVFTVPMLDRFKIDDVVGAIPVHLFAGIWGTIAVVFTNPDANLFGQLVAIVVVGVFVFVTSAIVWLILKAVVGLRPSEEEEALGFDKSEVGVEAYPEFK
ncbi:ammonium transporter [Arsenicitalea aurantiaca]|uniref:Ammonium transporter n=1 Tax=Arsenicitalea aurantiaca TaxID=1783274 RepID=A0A433X7V6_9HYPH|nr:ammonium transporter [Arsenicitalea aurantiaca]RUT30130.1 ammonium transporter [Arsenicitalea aurantiaca]